VAMRVGINVNLPASGGSASIDQLIEQVSSIAAQGFSTAWFADIWGVDALTVVALCGHAVSGIELGTAVVPVYSRHPVALARHALTTQLAIGGRLTLGIGLSHRPVVENIWSQAFDRPLEYLREYLAVLQPLLRREAVAFAGRRFRTQIKLTLPEASPPSVMLAALGERMLRLAGEQADGTVTWMVGPKTLAEHIAPVISRAARDAGRAEPRIVVGLPVCVTSDPETARAWAARAFERYGQLPSYRAMLDREGAAGPADVAIVGDESEVDRQLEAIERGGGTDFNASVFGSADEQRRTLEFLRARVRDVRGSAV
jgi:F420-dependent oxidoreductase-like protein